MKNILKVIVGLFIMFGLLQAEPLLQEGERDGYEVILSSDKSLVVGSNDIFVALAKDGETITNAKVKNQIFYARDARYALYGLHRKRETSR